MPAIYQSFGSERSMPLYAADGVPLIIPFQPFRDIVKIDEATLTVERKMDMLVFWNDLVGNVANAWKAQEVGSDQCFIVRPSLTSLLHRFPLRLTE